MKRLGSFLMGVVVGAAAVYGSLRYHVVRTDDGVEVVPKVQATFSETYVDVRGFGASEWSERRGLAMALARAGHEDVLKDAAIDQVRRGLDQLFGGLRPSDTAAGR